MPANIEIDLSGKTADEGRAELVAGALYIGTNTAHVTNDLTLIDNLCGASVIWSSDNENVITRSGKITRGMEEGKAMLTAMVTSGKGFATRNFYITVPEIDYAEDKKQYAVLTAEDAAVKNYEIEKKVDSVGDYVLYCNTTDEDADVSAEFDFMIEDLSLIHIYHINQGAKGIYDFVAFGNFFAELPVYSYHSKPETYEWSKEFREYTEKNADEIISKPRGDGIKTSYFYPGNQAWWPVTNKRAAALRADDYMDTRIIRFGDELIAQTFDPKVDKNILFVNLENAPATKRYGSKPVSYTHLKCKKQQKRFNQTYVY